MLPREGPDRISCYSMTKCRMYTKIAQSAFYLNNNKLAAKYIELGLKLNGNNKILLDLKLSNQKTSSNVNNNCKSMNMMNFLSFILRICSTLFTTKKTCIILLMINNY